MQTSIAENRTTPLVEALPWPGDGAVWAPLGARRRRFAWLDGDPQSTARGRYSFMTWNPHRVVRCWGDRVLEERWTDAGYERALYREPPWTLLGRLLVEERAAPAAEPANTAPRARPAEPAPPWRSGAVLALGFELAEWLEALPPLADCAGAAHDDPHCTTPDLHVAFHDTLIALDEVARRAWLVGRLPAARRPSGVLAELGPLRALAAAGGGARPAVTPLRRAPARAPLPPPLAPATETLPDALPFPAYARALGRIRAALRAGEVYQVNFSHPLHAGWPYAALDLFLAHRRLGRLPHAALVDLGDRSVCSFSPERLLARRGRQVETCPIKGTRPRGATPAADAALGRALLASAKDRAEHVMIVDLERNDLGRVCVPGSIRVEPFAALESYAAVHHLVSTVHGELRPAVTVPELLRALFPSGSVTGAPKLRATALIRRLERAPRRFYTGAIGYWDASGDCDLNVAIRTALVAGGSIEYRTGGGIVIDSDPQAEYAETRDKARALLGALAAAAAGGAA